MDNISTLDKHQEKPANQKPIAKILLIADDQGWSSFLKKLEMFCNNKVCVSTLKIKLADNLDEAKSFIKSKWPFSHIFIDREFWTNKLYSESLESLKKILKEKKNFLLRRIDSNNYEKIIKDSLRGWVLT